MEIKAVGHKVDVVIHCQSDDPILLDVTHRYTVYLLYIMCWGFEVYTIVGLLILS